MAVKIFAFNNNRSTFTCWIWTWNLLQNPMLESIDLKGKFVY